MTCFGNNLHANQIDIYGSYIFSIGAVYVCSSLALHEYYSSNTIFHIAFVFLFTQYNEARVFILRVFIAYTWIAGRRRRRRNHIKSRKVVPDSWCENRALRCFYFGTPSTVFNAFKSNASDRSPRKISETPRT